MNGRMRLYDDGMDDGEASMRGGRCLFFFFFSSSLFFFFTFHFLLCFLFPFLLLLPPFLSVFPFLPADVRRLEDPRMGWIREWWEEGKSSSR